MIKGVFSLADPDGARATLTVTMTVAEWAALRKQIGEGYPGWRFGAMVDRLIQHARQTFSDQVQTDE